MMPSETDDTISNQPVAYCSLPEEVALSVAARDEWKRSLQAEESAGLEFVLSDTRAWTPRQTLRVAFLGGTPGLIADIFRATREIVEACNIIFDFGHDPARGTYRSWSQADDDYVAEMRVSFDQPGFFSLVGTDSVNATIGENRSPVGGRPNQRSLNLGDFPQTRPSNWEGVVRHEFLHALAVQHSHQNLRGPCETDFRWDDDPGYMPTRKADGSFVPDAQRRRPGIYTYLSGPPNGWSRAKVDFNLRTKNDPASIAGPFDRQSVMLYRFPALFYKDPASECTPLGSGLSLSDLDRRGLKLLYPHAAACLPVPQLLKKEALLKAVEKFQSERLEGGESAGDFARVEADLLRRSLALHAS
jgi:hypothetical protein